MGMQVEGEEGELLASINVVPLVDVMLVMLIIFLIAVPVVIQTVPVELPVEDNVATEIRPGTIVISVDADGQVYWNDERVPPGEALVELLKTVAVQVPQPEIHIRGDRYAQYHNIGRVIVACQRAGIYTVGFITEPDLQGG